MDDAHRRNPVQSSASNIGGDFVFDDNLSGDYRVKVFVQSPRCPRRDNAPKQNCWRSRKRKLHGCPDLSSGLSSQSSDHIANSRSSTLSRSRTPSPTFSGGDVSDDQPDLLHVTFDTENLIREIDRISEVIQADFLLDEEFDDAFNKRQKVFLKNLHGIQKAATGVSKQLQKLQRKLNSEDTQQVSLTKSMSTTALSDLVHQYRKENERLKCRLDELVEHNRKLICVNENHEKKFDILRRQNQKLKCDLHEIAEHFRTIAHKVDQTDDLERQNRILIERLERTQQSVTASSPLAEIPARTGVPNDALFQACCERRRAENDELRQEVQKLQSSAREDSEVLRTVEQKFRNYAVDKAEGPGQRMTASVVTQTHGTETNDLGSGPPGGPAQVVESVDRLLQYADSMGERCDKLEVENHQFREATNCRTGSDVHQHKTDLAATSSNVLQRRIDALEAENRKLRQDLANNEEKTLSESPVTEVTNHGTEALRARCKYLEEETEKLQKSLLEEERYRRLVLKTEDLERSRSIETTVQRARHDVGVSPPDRHTVSISADTQSLLPIDLKPGRVIRPAVDVRSEAVQTPSEWDTGLQSRHHSEIAGNYVTAYNNLQTQYDVLLENLERTKHQLASSQVDNETASEKIRELWNQIGLLQITISGLKKKLRIQSTEVEEAALAPIHSVHLINGERPNAVRASETRSSQDEAKSPDRNVIASSDSIPESVPADILADSRLKAPSQKSSKTKKNNIGPLENTRRGENAGNENTKSAVQVDAELADGVSMPREDKNTGAVPFSNEPERAALRTRSSEGSSADASSDRLSVQSKDEIPVITSHRASRKGTKESVTENRASTSTGSLKTVRNTSKTDPEASSAALSARSRITIHREASMKRPGKNGLRSKASKKSSFDMAAQLKASTGSHKSSEKYLHISAAPDKEAHPNLISGTHIKHVPSLHGGKSGQITDFAGTESKQSVGRTQTEPVLSALSHDSTALTSLDEVTKSKSTRSSTGKKLGPHRMAVETETPTDVTPVADDGDVHPEKPNLTIQGRHSINERPNPVKLPDIASRSSSAESDKYKSDRKTEQEHGAEQSSSHRSFSQFAKSAKNSAPDADGKHSFRSTANWPADRDSAGLTGSNGLLEKLDELETAVLEAVNTVSEPKLVEIRKTLQVVSVPSGMDIMKKTTSRQTAENVTESAFTAKLRPSIERSKDTVASSDSVSRSIEFRPGKDPDTFASTDTSEPLSRKSLRSLTTKLTRVKSIPSASNSSNHPLSDNHLEIKDSTVEDLEKQVEKLERKLSKSRQSLRETTTASTLVSALSAENALLKSQISMAKKEKSADAKLLNTMNLNRLGSEIDDIKADYRSLTDRVESAETILENLDVVRMQQTESTLSMADRPTVRMSERSLSRTLSSRASKFKPSVTSRTAFTDPKRSEQTGTSHLYSEDPNLIPGISAEQFSDHDDALTVSSQFSTSPAFAKKSSETTGRTSLKKTSSVKLLVKKKSRKSSFDEETKPTKLSTDTVQDNQLASMTVSHVADHSTGLLEQDLVPSNSKNPSTTLSGNRLSEVSTSLFKSVDGRLDALERAVTDVSMKTNDTSESVMANDFSTKIQPALDYQEVKLRKISRQLSKLDNTVNTKIISQTPMEKSAAFSAEPKLSGLTDVVGKIIDQLEINRRTSAGTTGKGSRDSAAGEGARGVPSSEYRLISSCSTQTLLNNSLDTVATSLTTKPDEPLLLKISKQLSKLDRRVQEEISAVSKSVAESLPQVDSQRVELRRISRKLTRLDQSASRKESLVASDVGHFKTSQSVVSAAFYPKLQKISKKLTDLPRRVQENVSGIYDQLKEDILQSQKTSSKTVEKLQDELQNFYRTQTTRTNVSVSSQTSAATDESCLAERPLIRASSVPLSNDLKCPSSVKRAKSVHSRPSSPQHQSPMAGASDISSSWHAEHAKLKRQVRSLRNLLQNCNSCQVIPDERIAQVALKRVQVLSEQLQEVKGVVIQNTFAGGDAATVNRKPCNHDGPGNSNHVDSVRLCMEELTQCRAENRLLSDELRDMRKDRRKRGGYKRSLSDGETSSVTDDRLSDCLEHLKRSESTNKRLCRKIKKLQALLRDKRMDSSCPFTGADCSSETSGISSDSGRGRCLQQLSDCAKENKEFKNKMLKVCQTLETERKNNEVLLQRQRELEIRESELTIELEGCAQKLSQAQIRINEMEYDIRKLQGELIKYKQAREAGWTTAKQPDHCETYTSQFPSKEDDRVNKLTTLLSSQAFEIRKLREALDEQKRLTAKLRPQMSESSSNGGLIDQGSGSTSQCNFNEPRTPGNHGDPGREALSQQKINRLRQRIANQKKLISQLQNSSVNSQIVSPVPRADDSDNFKRSEANRLDLEEPLQPRIARREIPRRPDTICRKFRRRAPHHRTSSVCSDVGPRRSDDDALSERSPRPGSGLLTQKLLDDAVALSTHLWRKNRIDFEMYGDENDNLSM